jgi:DNA-binding NarL/FixJ family response regulator
MRVVLADDAALIRLALVDLLGRAGIQVLAQAGNAPLLLRTVEEYQPDVAIIDIRMPPTRRHRLP